MKRHNLQGQVVALETEKLHLENEKDTYWTNITKEDYIQFILNKLQELKGSDKE